jgi:hypothetical protein
MTLKTLADVRELIARHLPAERREQHIWRHVADQLAAAARGGSIENVVVSLRLALQLERYHVCRSERLECWRPLNASQEPRYPDHSGIRYWVQSW